MSLMLFQTKNWLSRIQDNPAGQDNELTPFIVIRDITGKEPEPFVPKKPKEA